MGFVSYFARTSLTPILFFLILSLFFLVILWFYLYAFNLSEIYFDAFGTLLGVVPTPFFHHWAYSKHKCNLCLSLQYNLNQNMALDFLMNQYWLNSYYVQGIISKCFLSNLPFEKKCRQDFKPWYPETSLSR